MTALIWSKCTNALKIITPEIGPEGFFDDGTPLIVKADFGTGIRGGPWGWMTMPFPKTFSYEFWMRTYDNWNDGTSDKYIHYYPQYFGGAGNVFAIEVYNGVLYIGMYSPWDGGWTKFYRFSFPYGINELHHFGIVYQEAGWTIRWFLDGVEQIPIGIDPGATWEQMTSIEVNIDFIFGRGTDGDPYMVFGIDNVKVWDYAELDYSDRFIEGMDIPPSIPTNVQATQNRPEYITTSWDAVPGVGIEYKVQRADTEFGLYSDVSGWISGLSYNDSTALVETFYWYRVKAKQGTTESEFSLGVEGFRPVAIPDVPADVTATINLTSKVRVSWSEAERATEYQVQRSLNSMGPYSDISGWNAPLIFDDTTAVPGTHYWYKVKSKNSSGESNLSSEAEGFRPVPSKFVLINCFNRIRGLINDN